MANPEEIKRRLQKYLVTHDVVAESCLGAGTQGSVFFIRSPSRLQPVAVKFHERERAYLRELAVYLRLRDLAIQDVLGHMVPQFIGHDDELLAIEMTIVSPPFVLDFGGAYLDQRPDYSPEVWEDWRRQKHEDFGRNWPVVEQILAEFEGMGIYIADVNPGNVRFE
jgi:hypothetical protein